MDGKVHVDVDDPLVRDFIERCLTTNEAERIDIDEIERHPLLAETYPPFDQLLRHRKYTYDST